MSKDDEQNEAPSNSMSQPTNEKNDEQRRELRKQYRTLLNDTESDRQVLLHGETSRLTDRITQANELFRKVKTTQEATLDSQVLLRTQEIASQKLTKLNLGTGGFDFHEYMSRVAKLIRSTNGSELLEWSNLSAFVLKHSLYTKTPTFMLGPLALQIKPKTVRTRTKKLEKDPSKLKVAEELKEGDFVGNQNETSANVHIIHQVLEKVQPVNFFRFVCNPQSFSQSVENLFYISFLVRDGKAEIVIDDETGEYNLYTAEPPTAEQLEESDCSKIQNIFHLDQKLWKDIIEAFGVTDSMIPHRQPIAANLSSKWYA